MEKLLLILIIATMTSRIVSPVYSEKENIIVDFYKSVNYDPDKDLLSFTIPKNIPEGYKFFLHISGTLYMGDKDSHMSFHAFDEESINYTWEKGKTYTYPLNSEGLASLGLTFGFVDENKNESMYTISISPDGTKVIEAD